MERLTAILGRTVYLDANIFIYVVEGYAPEEALRAWVLKHRRGRKVE
jgi:predicted nucleic acid-binding protein